MAIYVIDINERSQKGRQIKRLLNEKQSALKVYRLDEYEKQEEKALMKIMKEIKDEELLDAAQVRSTLRRIKKRATK